jgi:L-2,4-diaminobutyric acid acetyltransferase
MLIRNLNKDDISKIIDLIDKGRPYVVPYNPYVYWFLYNYYGTTCKVMEYENRIIGFISAMPSVDKKTIFIWQVCIDNDFRGRGFAELLLVSIKDEAKILDFSNLQLSISDENLASQKLFKRFAKKYKLNIFEVERVKFGQNTEIVFQIDI